MRVKLKALDVTAVEHSTSSFLQISQEDYDQGKFMVSVEARGLIRLQDWQPCQRIVGAHANCHAWGLLDGTAAMMAMLNLWEVFDELKIKIKGSPEMILLDNVEVVPFDHPAPSKLTQFMTERGRYRFPRFGLSHPDDPNRPCRIREDIIHVGGYSLDRYLENARNGIRSGFKWIEWANSKAATCTTGLDGDPYRELEELCDGPRD